MSSGLWPYIKATSREYKITLIICTSPCLAHILWRCCTAADLLTYMSKLSCTHTKHACAWLSNHVHPLGLLWDIRNIYGHQNYSQSISGKYFVTRFIPLKPIILMCCKTCSYPPFQGREHLYITHRMIHSTQFIIRHNQLPSVLLFPSQGH